MSIANHYLAEYDSQITQLSIRPTSTHHWLFPELKLTVHDSDINIEGLALTLDTNMSLFSLYSQPLSASQVMNLIEVISVKEIHAQLNPGVLTDEGKNVYQQGPTVALDLNELPQIDIGTTSLTLAGISPSALSLTMEYLTLDEEGNLNTAISRKGHGIFQLDARLTENQWRISSRLVFDELYTLLSELAAQELDNSALAPLIALKQESERLGLELSGSLASYATLDLKSAQLTSSHVLKNSSLTLSHFEGLTLAPHSLNTSTKETSEPDSVKFEIAGHLADLTFSLQPFVLEISPSPHQINSLLPLLFNEQHNQGSTPLIKAMLEPRRMTAEGKDKDENPAIEMSLTLNEPLEYSFVSKHISLDHAQFKIRDAMVDAQLSANDLSLQIPTQSQAFEFESKWHFAAAREQALLLSSLIPNEPDSVANKISDSPTNNKLTTDIRLGASSVSLAGKINIGTDTDHESPQLKLSIKPGLEAHITSVELVPSKVKQQSAKETDNHPPIKFELNNLKLVSHDELVITSNEASPMSLDIPNLTLSVGPTHYKQDIPTDLPSGAKALSFDANSLAFSTKGMSHLLIEKQLVDQDLISNKQAAKAYSQLALSAFSLESEDVQFIQSTGSRDSLTVSTAITHLTSLDQLVIKRMSGSADQDKQPLQISVPPLNFDQLDNELAFKPVPSAEKSEYLGKLSGLYLSLEKPSSLLVSGFTAEALSQVLTQNQWHNLLHYKLNGADLTHHYLKNKRKRTEKWLGLYTASLSQSLDWNGVKLDTHESWEFDGLEFVSEHRLQPKMNSAATVESGANSSGLQLTGKLNLATSLGNILSLVSHNYSLPTSLFITGDARLQAQYELNKNDNSTQMNINFTPELTSLSGSINELPFEEADVHAHCHYQLEQFSQSSAPESKGASISTLACPDIQFSADAFNPGVLITDIKAEADFSITHDDKLAAKNIKDAITESITEQQNTQIQGAAKNEVSIIPDTLSAASIQMNASGDLLGGQLLLPEFNLRLHDKSHGYLLLQGLELEQLLAIQPQVGLYADGIFDGVLPVDLVHGKIAVSGGQLAARAPGGLISVSGNPAVEQMRLSQPYLDFAFSTMEHLEYSELASTFDMQPSGDAQLKVSVKGKAKGIERPIHLNYSQEENMLQLLKSLQIGDKLQTQIEQSMN
ncbi:intermembrane phospholipid transport protein YdbH family protein [Shewanella psychrophila]|nr:YdbH domain-containing protein [Shewanella psychrophila]